MPSTKLIVHISEVDITPTTGMGRVEWHWKKAFEERGFHFLHIGPKEVGPYKHPGLFPYLAKRHVQKLRIRPLAYIVHEPASGLFTQLEAPCFVESHGVEQRYWELWKSGKIEGLLPPSWKTSLLYPLWRLRLANNGLKKAHKLLLLNNEDKAFVQRRWGRKENDIFVFNNGVEAFDLPAKKIGGDVPTILFNASWLLRKGINTLIKALQILSEQHVGFKLLLIGLGKHISKTEVASLLPFVKELEIIPSFDGKEEQGFLERSDIFVLPSFYEGKPLSLLQAMAAGLCCITTDTCGQKDLIDHRENGLLFEPGNETELATLLREVIQNPELATVLGRQAHADTKKLEWPSVSSQVVNFIERNITFTDI